MIWWSQGMEAVLEEDVAMADAAIRSFAAVCAGMGRRPACVFMIHPKVDRIRGGYIGEIRRRLIAAAADCSVSVIVPDGISLEDLNFGADLICAVTSTEEIKSTIAGGPPVLHFAGPAIRRWFEGDLGLCFPYLPDIQAGRSLIACDERAILLTMLRAVSPDFLLYRSLRFQAPIIDDAAGRIADLLLRASGA